MVEVVVPQAHLAGNAAERAERDGTGDFEIVQRCGAVKSQYDGPIAAGGLIIDDVWNDRRVITIDLLGDEFLETVKTGDKIKISEDGTVEVG